LQKSKKRDEIRTFINSECVKKLENEQKIRQSAITDIIDKLDKLDKLDTQDVDLNNLQDNINFIILISKIHQSIDEIKKPLVDPSSKSSESQRQQDANLLSPDRYIKSPPEEGLLTKLISFLPPFNKKSSSSIFLEENVKSMYYRTINGVKITKDGTIQDGTIQKTDFCIESIYKLAETLDQLNKKGIERNYKFIIIIALKILLYGKNTATQITSNTKLVSDQKKDIYDRFLDIIIEQFGQRK